MQYVVFFFVIIIGLFVIWLALANLFKPIGKSIRKEVEEFKNKLKEDK